MPDPAATTPPAPTQGNDPAARTETGAIVDQQATQPTGTAGSEPKQPDPAAKSGDAPKEPAKEPAKAATTGAPEKYELKAGEGAALDPKLVEAATPIFKELNLTQDQAQKLTDFWNKNVTEALSESTKAYDTMRTGWRDSVVKDTALGNGTDNLKPEVRANIDKAIQSIGTKEEITAFKEALDLTGVGDNPAFVKAFNTLGKLLSEGTAVRGAGPATTGQTEPGKSNKPSPAQALYPKLPTSAA